MLYLDAWPSFGADDREALRRLVRRVAKPGCRMLEIGSWLGTGSTRVIIDEILHLPDARLYCVDTWKGSPNVPRHQEMIGKYDIPASFRHNVKVAGAEHLVCQMVMTSQDAAAIVADGCLDLVFVDGNHAYLETRGDIARWKSKVRRGGIICGHDCECRPSDALRDVLLAARDEDSIPGTGSEFAAIHPGVVLAVEEAFGMHVHLWAEETMLRSDGTTGRATLWDISID
jgi:hypothetical protein